MKTLFNINQDQITFKKLLWYHFYMGFPLTIAYLLVNGPIIELGYPSITSLLFAELFVLAPIGLIHLFWKGKKLNGKFSLKNVIGYTEKLSFGQYAKWSVIGLAAIMAIFALLYPVGLYFRETLFSWLPEWYFNPSFGSASTKLLAKVFLFGVFIDGIVGPVVEELFFRGYLLPRMSYLKNWAPILNGALFGLYHFWQPHNFLALISIGIILSYIVWKKKNVYLGIIIHCTLNIIGALGGYIAAIGGETIAR